MKKKLKLYQALFWIIFSTIIISGTNYLIFLQIRKNRINKYISTKYHITTIAQNKKEITLNEDYLAQLMDLSVNKPTNIFLFNEEEARQKLLLSPVIKEAQVKKIKPNCIYVDYSIRKPIAYLYDFENVAIDDEGYIFPFHPFYPTMNLCKFYVDLDEFKGFEKIDNKRALYALDVYRKLKNSGFSDLVKIKVLDTSRLEHKSYGKREILLFIEEELIIRKNQKNILVIFPMILRLFLNNYLEQIGNYVSLRERIIKDYENQIKSIDLSKDIVKFKSKTIDLRLSKLAFIDQ